MRLKCLYCFALACVVWLALHATLLRAQTVSPSPATDGWDFQYDLFQLLLERQGLTPVGKVEDALGQPADSVIVMVGDPSRLPARAFNRLAQFVHEGGSLLIASDKRSRVPGIAQFMKGPVIADDAEDRYQGFADCVRVTEIAGGSPLAGVATIITNRSSWLALDSEGLLSWDIIATFSDRCSPNASRGQPLLAMGRSNIVDAGLVVLSADASPFTNGMLWHGDNAILAIRVSSLLSGSGRTRLAFWADGQVLATSRNRIDAQAGKEQANVNAEQALPEPDLKKVLKLANAIASEVAQSNVLNETLAQRPRNVRPSRYFRILLLLATLVMLLGAVWILATSGSLRPFSFGGRSTNQPVGKGRRVAVTNDSADYRAPAGYLAREFCWELTGSRQSSDWQTHLAQQLVFEPRLSPADQIELAKIIDIASRGCRERMNATDFQHLGKTIAALRSRLIASAASGAEGSDIVARGGSPAKA